MAFERAVRTLIDVSNRHAAFGFGLSLAAFFAVTVLPLGSLNPFAKTDVRVDADGVVHVHRPSLYASDLNPEPLVRPAFREGRFEIAITIAVAREGARGPARIVAFSEEPRLQNWILGQEGTGLHVRFGGRTAVFHDVFAVDRPTRLVVTFGDQEVTLAQDGGDPRTAPLEGIPRHWSNHCRFVVGNEVTGDRPWSGTIRDLVIRSLDEGDPFELALETTAPDGLDLVGTGVRVPIERVGWPWHYKWQTYQKQGGAFHPVTMGDRIRNVILTIPLGFFFVLWRRVQRNVPTLLAAFVLGAVVSAVAELHQFMAPGRVASAGDVLMNAIGSLLGGASALVGRTAIEKES